MLRLVPTSSLPDDISLYARRKIARAIDLFGDNPANQYSALQPDLKMLREAVDDAANLPVELFDACASASRRLTQRAALGECPSIEQDATLSDYLTRIREAGADILAHDPETQRVLDRRNAILGNTSLIDARTSLIATVNMIVPITEGRLALTLLRDAETASDPKADAEDRKASSYRLVGRVWRIGKWVVALPGAAAGLLGAFHYLPTDPIFILVKAAILRWLNM